MKCTNKIFAIGFSLLFLVCGITGCGYDKYDMPYTADSKISSFRIVDLEGTRDTVPSFASSLCVASSDVNSSSAQIPTGTSAGLFDIYGKNTIFAKNIHETLPPASLTKIMTAIVALKYGTPDQVFTATSNVKVAERDAQILGLKVGDQMTLDQALHVLLLYSANDVANLIAEGIGGSVDDFVALMNEEALKLGATNTHFCNPHGLSEDSHYTTAYDLYLITNEAIKFELFNEIVLSPDYHSVYYDATGNEQKVDIKSTNRYIQGNENAPDGITVIGGKTGTTEAAGSCLVIISKDTRSNPYISVVLHSTNRENLYQNMNSLLSLIPK